MITNAAVTRSATTGFQRRTTSQSSHRILDLSFAVSVVPLFLLAGLCLLLLNPFLNPGPLFFVQRRVGANGIAFDLWKFRTMKGRPATAAFVSGETHRLCPLGWWLRRWHLDELPQVLNLINGTMTCVGPRPEQPTFAANYAQALPRYHRRHMVKPGITGLAQVQLGYTDTLDGARKKLRWDLLYISRRSIAFDLYLIWRTVVLLTSGRPPGRHH